MHKKRKYNDLVADEEKQNDEDRLKRAVRDGDETMVRRLVKGGVLVNPKSRQWFGGTILHDAIASGKVSIVKLLLQAKADVNATTQDNRTCLHVAARTGYSGNTEIVKELLKSGADVNIQTKDKRTALHFATWRGNKDIVQQLVDNGANVNLLDEDMWSPLYWAAKLNYLEIAKILVGNGACLNCVNSMEMSPLHEVLKNGHIELAKFLITEGAFVSGHKKEVFQLLASNKDIKTEDRICLCATFIQAGYQIRNSLPHLLSSKPNIDMELIKFVQRQHLEVLTLKSLCRICIRNRLTEVTKGCSVRRKISELPLPKLLQEYVSFDR